MTKLQKLLENAESVYMRKIEKIALSEFNRIVKPYFEKYRLVYMSGNGTYYVGYTEYTSDSYIESHKGYYSESIDIDSLPKWLKNILDSETLFNNCLGEFMPNFEPYDYLSTCEEQK